jgi:arginine:agmatine antiporter
MVAARIAFGTSGMVLFALCAILRSVGSLGGWKLLLGQSSKAAADEGTCPSVFARLNRHGAPGRGLVIARVLMTLVLFATMSPTIAGRFNRIIDLAVILMVRPYVYESVAVVKVVFGHKLPRRTFGACKWIAIAAAEFQAGAARPSRPGPGRGAHVAGRQGVDHVPRCFVR